MYNGITAPFVAFAIWRRTGLGVWVIAIVWFTLSIFDHMDLLTTGLTAALPVNTPGISSRSAIALFAPIVTVLDLIALVLLTRGKMKSHYLGSPRPAEQ